LARFHQKKILSFQIAISSDSDKYVLFLSGVNNAERFVHTSDVGLAILLSDGISIETLLSFQIATAGDRDKQVMFSRLGKQRLN
jgi:hypothetical protein